MAFAPALASAWEMTMVLATLRTSILGVVTLGLLAIVPSPPPALAARVHGGCSLNAVRFATSDVVAMIGAGGSTDYVALPQSAVRFVQGKRGCATVSFSADLNLFLQTFEVKAVMDSSVVCDVGDSDTALGTGLFRRSWLFICPRVSPGAHIISMQAKSTPTPGAIIPSEVHRRTLLVHYFH